MWHDPKLAGAIIAAIGSMAATVAVAAAASSFARTPSRPEAGSDSRPREILPAANLPAPATATREDHIDGLLDQALEATFPASDPVALPLGGDPAVTPTVNRAASKRD